MKALLVFCGLIVCALAAQAQVVLTDDEGRQLKLNAPAARIVSLAPHVTELLFDAGAGTKLVGTVEYSDYPPAARAVTVVGDHARLDMERIIALRPDLVVAWGGGNSPADIAGLRRLGVAVFVIVPRHMDDVARHLELLGQLADSAATARPVAADYRRELAALRKRYADRPPVTVFFQVWHTPLMTVGGDQLISEVIALCGGENVFAGLRNLAPTVSVEAVLAADPELIVTGSEQPAAEALTNWRAWPQLRAVRNGQLAAIAPDDLHRATPRILRGAQALCEIMEDTRATRGKKRP